jgi:hypothetical protein
MAYEQVLRDLGLPPGAKLHEDAGRIRLWRFYFSVFKDLAEVPLPDPMREAA